MNNHKLPFSIGKGVIVDQIMIISSNLHETV